MKKIVFMGMSVSYTILFGMNSEVQLAPLLAQSSQVSEYAKVDASKMCRVLPVRRARYKKEISVVENAGTVVFAQYFVKFLFGIKCKIR